MTERVQFFANRQLSVEVFHAARTGDRDEYIVIGKWNGKNYNFGGNQHLDGALRLVRYCMERTSVVQTEIEAWGATDAQLEKLLTGMIQEAINDVSGS